MENLIHKYIAMAFPTNKGSNKVILKFALFQH